MNTFIGTQRDLPRSDVPLSLRAARTHHVLDRAPQVFPSPQGCKLGSARSWPTGSPGSRLGYGPEVRRKPFGFHLAMDTLPSARIAAHGRRVLLGLLSTHPPCEGAAGLSPARETPCWAHSPHRQGEAAAVGHAVEMDQLTVNGLDTSVIASLPNFERGRSPLGTLCTGNI